MARFHCPFEVKEVNDKTYTISGYGSVFGNVDSGGDMVVRGAFRKSLDQLRAARAPIKMLWRHNEPIGVWHEYAEDSKGLLLKGRPLVEDVQRAREAYALARAGAVNGLSIGYETVSSEPGTKGTRVLKEVNVHEVSLAVFPMNVQAGITSVKEIASIRELEDSLRDAGFSRRDSKAIASGGFASLRDAGGSSSEALRDADKSGELREALEGFRRSIRRATA